MTYLPLYQPVMYLKENIHLKEGKPQAVLGENGRVSALEVGGEAIPCDGIFFAKNSTAPESLLFGLETDGKNIVVGQIGHEKDSEKSKSGQRKWTEIVCEGIQSLFYELFKQFVNFQKGS